MKKVLVTGASGFIGSHLAEMLAREGTHVRAFVHYNSMSSWGWLDESPHSREMEIVSGDLRDFDSVSRAVKGMDEVFHLGALIGIPYSYQSPLAYVRTNIEGTYNVLEAARQSGTQKTVITSTSEVYGSARYLPIDEAHPLQPQSPYSATKIAADNLALSYHFSFQLPVTIARPFNTFGPRQSARAIIPTVATQLLSGSREIELGNLEPTRDFTFVEDTASGILAIGREKSFVGKAVNIGTGQKVSIGELARKLIQLCGSSAQIKLAPDRIRPETSEVVNLQSKNELLLKTTNWKPQHTLDQGLEKTVQWLRENLPRYKAGIYNV
jgi:NAD dependent epimerase/dehydratase